MKLKKKVCKSNAGRKPNDVILMFKLLVLQSLYNLRDEQVEYQVRGRLSFMRFLGLSLENQISDTTTFWLFRESMIEHNPVESLFKTFNHYLDRQGYEARKAQIIDASIVPVPRLRNSREENQAINAEETPEAWKDQPNKLCQKNAQARWTKKHDKSHYGYKRPTGASAQVPLRANMKPAMDDLHDWMSRKIQDKLLGRKVKP